MLGKYSEAMQTGSSDAVFEFFSPDFASHVSERVSPDRIGTDVRGEEQRWWQEVRAAFPDMTFSVDVLIEKDDLVVSHWTVKGTHTGAAFFDVAPTGEAVMINGTAILRIRDGQIVEHWGGPHCPRGRGYLPGI
jgi:predicted ester cyclase